MQTIVVKAVEDVVYGVWHLLGGRAKCRPKIGIIK